MSLPDFLYDRIIEDIRQQMDGVLALADQLARQRLTPDAQACVGGVAEGAGSVRRMLDAAVDLQTLSGEGLALNAAPVRLRELVDDIHDRWQPAAAMNGVVLLVSYDGDPEACAKADRQRLLQVFDGFVGEAVSGVRRGAVEASVRAAIEGEEIRLEGRVRGARDGAWADGEPLAEADSRFGLETTLGILLARRIIDGMDGTVRQEGAGGVPDTVVFDFRLPITLEAPLEAPAEPERSAHILVVDDNATNRMVAQALCEMFDCTCESANDGEEAVEAVRAGRFDLILMDIKMPRMDGVAATRAIRALGGAASRVPVIALTANADPDDAADYLAAGMNGVVEKPMKPEHLLAALQHALGEATEVAAA